MNNRKKKGHIDELLSKYSELKGKVVNDKFNSEEEKDEVCQNMTKIEDHISNKCSDKNKEIIKSMLAIYQILKRDLMPQVCGNWRKN